MTPAKLEIKHLAPYMPYGLKGIWIPPFKKTGKVYRMSSITTAGSIFMIWSTKTRCTADARPLNEFKPLLRPLSSLTEFMPEILTSLSKLDLSNCTFDEYGFDDNERYYWVNASENGRVIASLQYDFNTFSIYEIGNDNDLFFTYNPQIDALNELFKYHFDIFGLIDAGLAVDLNTVKL